MTLTACLICRNEANNLGACFDTLKAIADEIIVVDTGSTDNTPEVAASLGAKVYHERWINDFSHARNKSLSYATCDWLMWMDADDRLPEKTQKQIAVLKNDPLKHAFAFHVKNINPQPIASALTTYFTHMRMWPRLSGVEFRGRLHESPLQSAVECGLVITDTDIIVEHHGYQDAAMVHEKMIRNIKLKMIEMNFPEANNPLLVEIGDLMCFYVPNVLTVWKDMGMIWLSQPFEYDPKRPEAKTARLIEEYVRKNAFV